jgi:hypothetical protein
VVVVWVVAFLLPAPGFSTFDGLPSSSLAEVGVLLAAVAAVASGRARVTIASAMERFGFRAVAALLILGFAVAVMKIVLLAFAPVGGFRACYSTPVAPRPGGGCELSYENLFSRDDATRFDEVIDFGPRVPPDGDPRLVTGSDWDLSFVNELRLNVIHLAKGDLDLERLPFSATWRGEIQADERGWIPVRYVGEGRARIGATDARLRPSYGEPRTVLVPVPKGVHDLRLAFRFADRQLVGTEPRGSFATLRVGAVQRDRVPELGNPLRTKSPALTWRFLAFLVDLAFAGVALALAGALGFAFRRSWPWLIGAALLGIVSWGLTNEHSGFAEARLPIAPTVVAFVVVVVVLLYRRIEDLVVIGCLGAIALAVERVLVFLPDLHSVIFRPRGQDSLSYEWFARQILETGSLQAGEKVFYYQPGFRYWVFAGHVLFGDGDALPVAIGVALLVSAVVVATRWSVERARQGRALPDPISCLVVAVTCAALLVAVTSPQIVGQVAGGISEYPTWIAVPIVPALLFGRPSLPRWMAGSVLLALTVDFRPDQGIAALLLMAVFVVWQARRDPRRTAWCVGVFVGILLLPALHNLWYGGRLELLPTGASSVEDLPPGRLLDVFTDPAVRTLLRDKLAALLYLTPKADLDAALGAAILTLQVAWLACVARALRHRHAMPWHGWCLLAWPLTYAIPALSYDVFIYYPRHIFVIYVAAGAAVIFVEARYLAPALERSSSTSIDPRPEAPTGPEKAPLH